MSKTIQEQITEMEKRCNQLTELQKLFDKAVKMEFGIDTKKIHKIIKNGTENQSSFETKIASYFGLKTNEDFVTFLNIFCTENSFNYYNNHKEKSNM